LLNQFNFEGQGVNVMDLSSEMNKHGRNPVTHKLEDQKKVRLFLVILNYI